MTTDIDAAVEQLLTPAPEPEREDQTDAPQEETLEGEATEDDAKIEAEADAEAEQADAGEDEEAASGEADDGVEAPDDDEATESSDADEELISVSVDGMEEKVTFEELKRGYSGQAKIQRGMQENAEMKNQLREAYQTLEAERQNVLTLAQQLQQGGVAPKPQEPEYNADDPIGSMERMAEYQRDMKAYEAQQSEFLRMQEQRQAFTQKQREVFLRQQAEVLQKMVPEYADPKTAEAFHNDILKTAQQEYGIPADEVNQLVDARHMKVLADAARYRKLMAEKDAAKVKPKPSRTVKPKGRQESSKSIQRKKAVAKARQSGSLTDFVDLLVE